jgi:hypothetical protein
MSRPNSILDAIHGTRHAFERINMEPPKVITLSSHDDGMRLLMELDPVSYHSMPAPRPVIRRPHIAYVNTAGDDHCATMTLPHSGKRVIVDAVDFMEVEVMGIKVRWPAKVMALPDGQHLWY